MQVNNDFLRWPCCKDHNTLFVINNGVIELPKTLPPLFETSGNPQESSLPLKTAVQLIDHLPFHLNITKISAIVKAYLAKEVQEAVFIVNPWETPLHCPLLVDKTRGTVTLLFKGKLPSNPEGGNGDISSAIEVIVNENGASLIFQKVVQKTAKGAKNILISEFTFTKLFGNALSAGPSTSTNLQGHDLMTMEAFEYDLAQAFKKNVQLSGDQKIKIIHAVLEKLKKMHQAKILHFDIKLSNILIRKTCERHVKAALCDFGLAHNEQQLSQIAVPCYGSPFFTAPELWERDLSKLKVPVTEALAFDMFAFGIVVYSLLYNQECEPFSQEEVNDAYNFRNRNVERMLKKEPISEHYNERMRGYLQSYKRSIQRERDKLWLMFSHKKSSEALSAEEILAYLAFGLLQPDPSHRLSVEEVDDLLTSFEKTGQEKEDLSVTFSRLSLS